MKFPTKPEILSGLHQAINGVLREAIDGLTYTSETDTPFYVFQWPNETGQLDPARILELRSLLRGQTPADRPQGSMLGLKPVWATP